MSTVRTLTDTLAEIQGKSARLKCRVVANTFLLAVAIVLVFGGDRDTALILLGLAIYWRVMSVDAGK